MTNFIELSDIKQIISN